MSLLLFSMSGVENIIGLTLMESCLWLLIKLKIHDNLNNPYCLPFCNYVLTWSKSVPLTAIIIAQSPYPNDIFPSISAAMSYDVELCIKVVEARKFKSPIPPTVQVLANDLYINAGMKKEDTEDVIRNGWMLIDRGILLINERVFSNESESQYYIESCSQLNVIIRLLRETETYGERTVDVYGFGVSGQRMASNLCSWYKSTKVRLSKHTCTHPAALTRRYEDFNDPMCHMESKSFSKSLVKHLSNCVAYVHSMSRRNNTVSELELRSRNILNSLRIAGEEFPKFEKALSTFNESVKGTLSMDSDDKSKFKECFTKLLDAGRELEFRSNMCSAILLNIQSNGQNISNYVSKPGPSMMSPNASSIATHTGQESYVAPPMSLRQVNLQRKITPIVISKSVTGMSKQSHSTISRPPSVISLPTGSITSTPSTPVRLVNIGTSRKKITLTSPTEKTEDIGSSSSLPPTTPSIIRPIRIVTTPSVSLPRMKQYKTAELVSSVSATSTQKEENKDKNESPDGVIGKKLSNEIVQQLSCIEAVLALRKPDYEENDECTTILENIQNDIKYKTIYNFAVAKLVNAIEKDMDSDKKFDFTNWAFKDDVESATYDVCKELFDF